MTDELSPCEKRVLLMVVEECMSTKQIAYTLGRSEKVIEVHRDRIFKKLRVRSLSALCKIYWTQLAVA